MRLCSCVLWHSIVLSSCWRLIYWRWSVIGIIYCIVIWGAQADVSCITYLEEGQLPNLGSGCLLHDRKKSRFASGVWDVSPANFEENTAQNQLKKPFVLFVACYSIVSCWCKSLLCPFLGLTVSHSQIGGDGKEYYQHGGKYCDSSYLGYSQQNVTRSCGWDSHSSMLSVIPRLSITIPTKQIRSHIMYLVETMIRSGDGT